MVHSFSVVYLAVRSADFQLSISGFQTNFHVFLSWPWLAG